MYDRFDPDVPVLPKQWRAERKRSPANDIIRSMSMPMGQPRVLVTGTIGSGKSTELLRIAQACAARELVVFLDLRQHFREVVGDEQALLGITSWEVVFLGALAVARAASELLPTLIPEDYLKDLSQAWQKLSKQVQADVTPPQIDIGAAAKAMIVLASAATPLAGLAAAGAAAVEAGIKTLDASSGALKWGIPIGRKKKALLDQDADVQSMLAAANRIIGLVQSKVQRVLLIIDGLDRIRSFERAKALFIDSELMGQLACPLVLSGPFALRSHPAAGTIPRFTKISVLVNEPVLDHKKPDQHGAGVAFFLDLFALRTSDIAGPPLATERTLQKLAYYSGGRVRDFVKSIRMLAEKAWLEDADHATDEIVGAVLDEARRLLETGLDAGHIEVMEAIAKDPNHRLSVDPRARELLEYGQLLPYPNESEWYYPHPLLTLHMVRVSTAGSSA